eukprot:15351819-Ditylum_brightwellii.AAC.1
MRYVIITLATLISSALAAVDITPSETSIAAISDLGKYLLSSARRLEDQDDDEMTLEWIADYSLKFLGCHHIVQFVNGENGGDEDDNKVFTKRLARFRLCPSDRCSGRGLGCNKGYGDYIVDLNEFAQAYTEAKRRRRDQECEMYLWKYCDCDKDNHDDDSFNEEYCEYDCFVDAGRNHCIDRNPYDDDEGREEEFEPERYMECGQFELKDDNRRHLEDAEEEIEYYLGPYCANQGGSVYLGMFTDETCTNFADEDGGRDTFLSLTGEELPYGKSSIINNDCVSCFREMDVNKMKELEEADDDRQNDEDEDIVNEQCEDLYQISGKCETLLPESAIDSPNENACSYIQGVSISVSESGIVVGRRSASPTANFFIVVL